MAHRNAYLGQLRAAWVTLGPYEIRHAAGSAHVYFSHYFFQFLPATATTPTLVAHFAVLINTLGNPISQRGSNMENEVALPR